MKGAVGKGISEELTFTLRSKGRRGSGSRVGSPASALWVSGTRWFVVMGAACALQGLEQHPSLYSLDASSHPRVWRPETSSDITKCPSGGRITPAPW